MPDSASITSATPTVASFRRRLPIGVEPIDATTAHVRVWAPRPSRVEIVTDSGERTALVRDSDGYFAGVFKASAGDRYRFKLDDDEKLYPDPASRFQPDGPHGASETFRLLIICAKAPSPWYASLRGFEAVQPACILLCSG